MIRFRNIWETSVQVWKMEWLFLETVTWNKVSLCNWDNQPNEVIWRLSSGSEELWEWIIFTREQVWKLIQTFQDGWQDPIKYRLRPWRLWRPKTRGYLRLMSNWEDTKFCFQAEWWHGYWQERWLRERIEFWIREKNRVINVLTYQAGDFENRIGRIRL